MEDNNKIIDFMPDQKEAPAAEEAVEAEDAARVTQEEEAVPPIDIDADIVIDDGYIEKTIRNKAGKIIGTFGFRPTDLRIIDRYNDAVKKFDSIIEPLKDADINPDGTASDAKQNAALKEAEARIYELCDYILDGNVTEAFFNANHPFAPINGHFYCENVINAVGAFLGAYFDTELNAISKRVLKYTHGYRTGKHRKGRK